MLGCYVGMTSSPATYVLSDKVQSAVVGKGIISQSSGYPSLGYDKLRPKEGEEEGLYVGQDANEGKESGDDRENGLNLTATGDQESKTDEEVEAGLYLATVKKQETFYSPLGEPDLRDLPSFAHQISQGMVCKSYCKYVLQLQLYNFLLTLNSVRNTFPPWVSSTGTWPAATSWWMRGSCSRYQILVSHETHSSTCPPSRTRCH